jgi:threonine dehydratase
VHVAPENRICVTIQEMLNLEGIVLEPAGALAVDVLDEIRDRDRGSDGGLRDLGREFRFRTPAGGKGTRAELAGAEEVLHPAPAAAPGALRDFLDLLGPGDNITRFEYLKKNSRNFGSVLIGIETDDPGNFDAMIERVTMRGFGFRDITEDEVLADFLI